MISASELANAMGITHQHLIWLCNKADDMYEPLAKPKRDGSIRYVYSPNGQLRKAQTWLLANVIDKLDASEIAMAFEQGTSTVKALRPHAGNLTLIRIDLADFYGHIGYAQVARVFYQCGLSGPANDSATMLCTLNSGSGASLPQGGICSPMIANRSMILFDAALVGLAEKWHAVVTRYADDILISLASTIGKDATARLVEDVTNIAFRYGHEVNEHKTHAMVGAQRKSALGLTVGDTVTMFRRARHNFRAMCYQIEILPVGPLSKGQSAHLAKCRGMFSYMQMVDPEHARMFGERYTWLND